MLNHIKSLIIVFSILFLINTIISLPVYVKPLDGSNNLQPSTSFSYEFNFTTNSDCSGVVLTNKSTITTGSDGIGFIDINLSGISGIPKYLCEYRAGSLRKTHLLSDQTLKQIYSESANFTNNITANWFFGKINYTDIQNPFNFTRDVFNLYNSTWDESGICILTTDLPLANKTTPNWNNITGIPSGFADNIDNDQGNSSWTQLLADTLYSGIQWNYNQTIATFNLYNSTWDNNFMNIWNYNQTTASLNNGQSIFLNLSGTNANQNINFGNNNFTINGTTFFVNTNTGNVGIGTTAPSNLLDVRGVINASGKIYLNNATDISLWLYNQTLGTFNNYNSTWDNNFMNVWNYNQSTATYNTYNTAWSSTYNETYLGCVNNASYLSTFNSTYDNKISFVTTNIAWTNQTNIFTANQNMSSKNVTDIDCIYFKSGGRICSGT